MFLFDIDVSPSLSLPLPSILSLKAMKKMSSGEDSKNTIKTLK